jgi:hypothetical protein
MAAVTIPAMGPTATDGGTHPDLAPYGSGTLSAAKDLTEHLRGCPTCREELRRRVWVAILRSLVDSNVAAALARPGREWIAKALSQTGFTTIVGYVGRHRPRSPGRRPQSTTPFRGHW